MTKGFRNQKVENSSAANIFKQVKHLILTSVTMSFVDKKIEKMETGSENHVCIDRHKAKHFEEAGKVDHTGEFTEFGQIFTKLNGDYSCWKQNKPDD